MDIVVFLVYALLNVELVKLSLTDDLLGLLGLWGCGLLVVYFEGVPAVRADGNHTQNIQFPFCMEAFLTLIVLIV